MSSAEPRPTHEMTAQEIRAELQTATGDRAEALQKERDQRRAIAREIGRHLYGFR